MNIGATGGAGEDAALKMLLESGFALVARNYQTKYGEIDLIVRNERFLVFVEVKTRTKASWYKGYAAVTSAKKQKILKSAILFLRENPMQLQPRIDVIDIEGHWFVADGKEQFSVDGLRWYKNAITADDYGRYL